MFTLVTKNKTINLVFKTKKIVNIANILKEKNFEEVYFKTMKELDLNALTKIIFHFAEFENQKEAFNSSEDVYDFLDEYKTENKKSYYDIFKEIAEAVNEEGFFIKKMTEEELQEKISNPLSEIKLEELMKPAMEKAMIEVAKEEIMNTTV